MLIAETKFVKKESFVDYSNVEDPKKLYDKTTLKIGKLKISLDYNIIFETNLFRKGNKKNSKQLNWRLSP